MKKQILCLMIFLISYPIYSQNLSVFNIDASAFPNVKANFFAFDGAWNQQNLAKSDLILKENGVSRTIQNVNCPSPKTPIVISSVLVMDISSSMVSKTSSIAKAGAKTWVSWLPSNNSECAITSYDEYNYINQKFTSDKNKLIKAIDDLSAGSGTDYNKALIDPMAGGLIVTKTGQYQKVLVLLTDGLPSTITDVKKIIEEAKLQNCKIFVIAIDLPCPKDLQDISTQTGGGWYENVGDENQISDIYHTIMNIAQGGEPCEISWQSGVNCDFANNNVELAWNGEKAAGGYRQPATVSYKLIVEPNIIRFDTTNPGQSKDTSIRISAKDVDIKISAINLIYGSNTFQLKNVNLPLIILKNTSIEISIRYSPLDSNMCYAGFEIITDYCPASFSCIGGFAEKPIRNSTLRLTHPIGGEVFVAGVDTLITWEGVVPSDLVTLEYSIDNGNRWLSIANRVSGLKYIWKNVPKPASQKCLIRVKQYLYSVPNIEWQKSIGGSKSDGPKFVIQKEDSSYIVFGNSNSTDGDITENKGSQDYWITNLSKTGTLVSSKNYGGSKGEFLTTMCRTSDGGYIIAGESSSTDGDVTVNKGYIDCLIIKFDNKGQVEWRKSYGGSGYDKMRNIQQTPDGGYILSGYTGSRDGDIKNYVDGGDIWVLKLSSSGAIEWSNSLGGSGFEDVSFIKQTPDGGYLVYGGSNSNDGDVTCNPNEAGIGIPWVVKLNSTGSIIWDKIDSMHLGNSYQTNDGGYVYLDSDYNFVKINDTYDSEWKTAFRNSNQDQIYSIKLLKDGSYLLIGTKNHIEHTDYWLVKISSSGSVEWQKTLGGSKYETPYSVDQTNDEGYIIAGESYSSDGDVTENKGLNDIWIVKLSSENAKLLQFDKLDAVFSIVTPVADAGNIDMKKCLLKSVKDSIVTNFIRNMGSYKFNVNSIYFRGDDAEAFSLVSALPKYIVSSSAMHNAEIRFIPTKVGLHQAEVVIITQSDTLIKKITGEGVSPQIQIENKIIDFGKVDIGNHRDTLQVVTIKNIGTSYLYVTKTNYKKPNQTDFTTLAGGGSFTLKPNESKTMDLRFKPSEQGPVTNTLEFYYSGVGSPAKVQLYGEGGDLSPQILAKTDEFPNLICEQSTKSDIAIKNIGGKTLIINEINLKGNNSNDFKITEILPIELGPDSLKIISVIFKPQSTGIKTADIEFKSNAISDSVLTIQLTAKKDSIAIVPELEMVNLGVLCPDEARDTVINLKNIGTITSKGYVDYSSNLGSSISSFRIDSGSTFQLAISFKGSADEGDFSEKVTIKDSICEYEQEIIVTGTIALPSFIAQDVSISSVLGLSNSSKIIISNNSSRDFSITNVVGIKPPFELMANPFPIEIKVNSLVELLVKYAPDDNIEDSLSISLIGEPCNLTQSLNIFGRILNFSLIYPANAQTGLGQAINFKWSEVIEGKYYQLQISKNEQFTDLVYSKDSLTTTEHYVPDLEPQTLYYWRVRVWNEESIGSAIWSEVWTFETETSGVCDESEVIEIVPNPAGDFITITIKYSDCSTIQIYNTLGEMVLSESIHPMTASHRMNIESLPKGVYFVKIGGETAKFIKL
jgi:hypothetical protein